MSVNGRAVTASGLTTETGGGVSPNQMLGEFLVLPGTARRTGSVARPRRAAGRQPAAAVAHRRVSPHQRGRAVDPLTTGSIGKAGESEESLATASLDPDPEGGMARCDLDQVYNVVGFNENSNALTPRLTRRLDQVVADIGGRQCKVQVTGYSSTQGAIASNALFAVERAQNSLRYLTQHGVRFVHAIATGAGATTQFGLDYRSNRRVVITVTP